LRAEGKEGHGTENGRAVVFEHLVNYVVHLHRTAQRLKTSKCIGLLPNQLVLLILNNSKKVLIFIVLHNYLQLLLTLIWN
jgi:hypothetical protein